MFVSVFVKNGYDVPVWYCVHATTAQIISLCVLQCFNNVDSADALIGMNLIPPNSDLNDLDVSHMLYFKQNRIFQQLESISFQFFLVAVQINDCTRVHLIGLIH